MMYDMKNNVWHEKWCKTWKMMYDIKMMYDKKNDVWHEKWWHTAHDSIDYVTKILYSITIILHYAHLKV